MESSTAPLNRTLHLPAIDRWLRWLRGDYVTALFDAAKDPFKPLERLIDVQLTAAAEQAQEGGHGWWLVAMVAGALLVGWLFVRLRR